MFKRIGFIIVLAALAVSGPRLATSFIIGHGLVLAPAAEGWIYGLTGVATAVVLTGGNAWLAHVLARRFGARDGLWWIMATSWVLFLVFVVILTAPELVMGLGKSELATVLDTQRARWFWAITAVVSVEVLTAAAMAGHVLDGEPATVTARSAKPSRLSRLLDAATERAVDTLEGSDRPQPATVTAKPNGVPTNSHTGAQLFTEEDATAAREARELSRDERRREIEAVIAEDPDIARDRLAEMFAVSESTIYRDLRAVTNGRAG